MLQLLSKRRWCSLQELAHAAWSLSLKPPCSPEQVPETQRQEGVSFPVPSAALGSSCAGFCGSGGEAPDMPRQRQGARAPPGLRPCFCLLPDGICGSGPGSLV